MRREQNWRDSERQHYDSVVTATGESWWGHTTDTGARRLRRRAEILSEMLPTSAPTRVLEVGCGAGSLTAELLKTIPNIDLTAGDLSPVSVERARARCREFPNVTIETQDVTQLSYPDASFDAVVGNSVLHHVPTEAALADIFRVTREGGFVLFFEPNLVNPQLAFDFTVGRRLPWYGKRLQLTPNERPFVRWRLRRIIERVGFTSVCVEPIDFLHPLVPARWARIVDHLGRVAEGLVGVREFSGSLAISATKPTHQARPRPPQTGLSDW